MNFWRWYLRWFSPLIEYIAGVIITTLIGTMVAAFAPLWLLLLIPVGITVAAHGYWREFERN